MKKNKTLDYYIAKVITYILAIVNITFGINIINHIIHEQYHCAMAASTVGILFAILTILINKELWRSKN